MERGTSSKQFSRLGLVAAVIALALVPSIAHGQGEAKFEWQKKAATIAYGVPRVGKHTIDELEVGSTWRVGANDITTLTIDAPLIAGDAVVSPGVYRINVARQEKEKFELTIEGAGRWMAAGGDEVRVPARLEMVKPNDKLEIAFQPATAQTVTGESASKSVPQDPEVKALSLTIQFGAPKLTVPVGLVGTQTQRTKGFTVDAFKLPEKWLSDRLGLAKHSPVATLTRLGKVADDVPERLNLLLSEQDAMLVPALKAPTDNNGSGTIPYPDSKWTLKGTVTWTESSKPAPNFRIDTVEIEKDGTLHVMAACGSRTADIHVPTSPTKN